MQFFCNRNQGFLKRCIDNVSSAILGLFPPPQFYYFPSFFFLFSSSIRILLFSLVLLHLLIFYVYFSIYDYIDLTSTLDSTFFFQHSFVNIYDHHYIFPSTTTTTTFLLFSSTATNTTFLLFSLLLLFSLRQANLANLRPK